MFKKNKVFTFAVIILFILLLATNRVFASSTDGTIPINSYVWGENIGWINFGTTNGNVHVTDTAVTGYAWSSTYGWINLSPTNNNVTNNCSGQLGGYAWSSSLGWIPFDGVTINASGRFTGMAGISGSTAGRINFDCTNCNVTTDWRQCSLRSTASSASSPTTSASTASSTTGLTCSAAKPGGAPTILSAVAGGNSITLFWSKATDPLTHYLIAYGTKSGSIQYGNPNVGGSGTTSYTVKRLSAGATYYFKIKAINDCLPGDFSNEVSASVVGGTRVTGQITPEAPAESFVPAAEISSQLFDITLTIDQPMVEDSKKLAARVTFASFGTQETPVDMQFVVLDTAGRERYKTTAKTAIRTEGIYNQKFADLAIPDGKYTLLLRTLYNVDVRDEFRAPFEVKSACTSIRCVSCKQVRWIIPTELVLIIFLIWKKRQLKKGGI